MREDRVCCMSSAELDFSHNMPYLYRCTSLGSRSSTCRKTRFRQVVRLPRKVQDGLFFAPKVYKGTPRGQKKVKTMLKSYKARCFVRFLYVYKSLLFCFLIFEKTALLFLCFYRQSAAAQRRGGGHAGERAVRVVALVGSTGRTAS